MVDIGWYTWLMSSDWRRLLKGGVTGHAMTRASQETLDKMSQRIEAVDSSGLRGDSAETFKGGNDCYIGYIYIYTWIYGQKYGVMYGNM